MRKGGGKKKGASFERSVCKQLSLWMSHGLREDLYWRSAMSGGRATVAASKGTRLAAQAGDITAIDPAGEPLTRQFLIECKHYKNLHFSGLLNNTGELSKFWIKHLKDAYHYGKLAMLIARQNSYPAIICVDETGVRHFGQKVDCVLTAPGLNFYAFLLNDFLANAIRLT
jgi:hypothetical protein